MHVIDAQCQQSIDGRSTGHRGEQGRGTRLEPLGIGSRRSAGIDWLVGSTVGHRTMQQRRQLGRPSRCQRKQPLTERPAQPFVGATAHGINTHAREIKRQHTEPLNLSLIHI